MTILFKNEKGELKEEKIIKVVPCTLHLSVIFENGAEEMIPIQKAYGISCE